MSRLLTRGVIQQVINSSGGGGGVTPSPTPNWANISFNYSTLTSIVAVQQIQNISSTITLEVTRSVGGFSLYVKLDSTAPGWSNGGAGPPGLFGFSSWTLISSFPYTFNVSNNQYVSFGCAGGSPASSIVTIKNNSDGAITLDTFTADITSGGPGPPPAPPI